MSSKLQPRRSVNIHSLVREVSGLLPSCNTAPCTLSLTASVVTTSSSWRFSPQDMNAAGIRKPASVSHHVLHTMSCRMGRASGLLLLAAIATAASLRVRQCVRMTALRRGDKVVVVGATGGVGQLVAARLAAEGRYRLRAVARDEGKTRQVLGLPDIEYAAADSKDIDTLISPLSDADAVIIATGTSALPSPRWQGGNTPDAVDRKGVRNILNAITAKPRKRQVKKVVFLSSVGVLRSTQIPFSILNLFGVLDAKRDSEEAIRSSATQERFDYTIVRPGRLVGGPWTNTDVSNLLKTEEGSRKRVLIRKGDELNGDAARFAVAELVVRSLERPEAANQALCMINEGGEPLTDSDWDKVFKSI